MFENINWMVSNIFAASNDDFVIRENESPEDIETSSGVAVTDEKKRTCALCVALNNTVFRNDNKPEYYHPHCKCKITKYTLNKVVFDFPMEKITGYLFKNENKKAMMHSMGYIPDDYREVYELIKRETEKSYLSSGYTLNRLDIHGQRFTVKTVLRGKREHLGEYFNCHTGCMAWPYGKIKITTPLIKD